MHTYIHYKLKKYARIPFSICKFLKHMHKSVIIKNKIYNINVKNLYQVFGKYSVLTYLINSFRYSKYSAKRV